MKILLIINNVILSRNLLTTENNKILIRLYINSFMFLTPISDEEPNKHLYWWLYCVRFHTDFFVCNGPSHGWTPKKRGAQLFF